MTHTLKLAALSVSALALMAGTLAAATLDEIRDAGTIRIAVVHGNWLVAEKGGGKNVKVNRTGMGAWETFTILAK